MKKVLLLVLAIALNSFATYFDYGVGFGSASTHINHNSVEKPCGDNCKNEAADINFRIGDKISDHFIIAAELAAVGNFYYGDNTYTQFTSFFIGPSLIYYPIPELQFSGSLGITSSYNDTDKKYVDLHDDVGVGAALTGAIHIGKERGALLGIKAYLIKSQVEYKKDDQKHKDDYKTIGASFFASFVHL